MLCTCCWVGAGSSSELRDKLLAMTHGQGLALELRDCSRMWLMLASQRCVHVGGNVGTGFHVAKCDVTGAFRSALA
jgi:hypothetical protein